MTMPSNRWTPSVGIRNHAGGLLPPDAIFFAPPPPEIGEVLSAHTGLRGDGSAMSQRVPRRVVSFFALLGAAFGGFVGYGVAHGQWLGMLCGMVLGILLIGGPIFRRERMRNDCTYVGTQGVARFPVGTARHSYPKGQILLFADAAGLQTAFLGRNMGTNFNYRWKDARGKTLYMLEGGYFGNKQNTDSEAAFHFARAAEEAWSRYLLPHVTEEIQSRGSTRFVTRRGLSGEQYAVIGRGYLEIVTGEKRFRCDADAIDDILVFQGWIVIRRKDATKRQVQSFDGSHGICYLSYGTVVNVRVFLTLIKNAVGVAWRTGD